MKYRAKLLKFNGTFWTCVLERWKGCECNAEATKVLIQGEKRPSLAKIKDCAVW